MVPHKLDSGQVYNPVSIDSIGIKNNATNHNLLHKLFSEGLFTNLPSDLVYMYYSVSVIATIIGHITFQSATITRK